MPRNDYRFAETRRNLLWGLGILTLLTWILGVAIPKHVPISFQLPIANFDEPGAWTIDGEPDSVKFTDNGISVSVDSHINTFASFEFDRRSLGREVESGIRISGDVSYDISYNKNRRTLGGAIWLIEYADEPKALRQLFLHRYLNGRSGTERWSKVAFPNQNAQKFGLKIGLGQNAGTISLSNPSIQIVKTWPPFQWIFYSVIIAWFMYWLRVGYHFIESGNGPLLCVPAVLSLIIGLGVLLPSDSLTFLLKPINIAMHKYGLANPDWIPVGFSAGKLGHVLGFALFAFVALLMRKRFNLSVLQMTTAFLLLAIATEGLQLFLPDRSTRIVDVIFDGAGVLIGVVGYAVWVAISQALFAVFFRFRKTIDNPNETGVATSKPSG